MAMNWRLKPRPPPVEVPMTEQMCCIPTFRMTAELQCQIDVRGIMANDRGVVLAASCLGIGEGKFHCKN